MTVVHSDMHRHEQFLQMSVSLGLGLVLVHLFRLSILCVFLVYYIVLVLFAFAVLDLVSSLLRQEIGWEERLWNDLFCIEWDVKP